MKKFLLLVVLLISVATLGSCNGGSLYANEKITYVGSDGSSVIHERTIDLTHADSTTKPPQVTFPETNISEQVIGNKPILDLNGRPVLDPQTGETLTTPIVGIVTDGGSTSIIGPAVSNSQAAMSLFRWPMAIGAILLGGGIILLFAPIPSVFKKMGIGASLAGAALMGIGYLFAAYGIYIMVTGGLIFVGLLIFGVWQIRKQDKAIEEQVELVEVVKEELPEDKQDKIFKDTHSLAKKIQSKTTARIVEEKRQKIAKESTDV